MNSYALIILLGLIYTYQVNEASTSEFSSVSRKSEYIKVLDTSYKYGDEIKLLVQGKLRATGDCVASPQLGLIRKNETNNWDTLVAVNELPVFTCGFGSHVWSKDTIAIFLPEIVKPYIYDKMRVSGIYRFTFIPYKSGNAVIKSSNEFKIVL